MMYQKASCWYFSFFTFQCTLMCTVQCTAQYIEYIPVYIPVYSIHPSVHHVQSMHIQCILYTVSVEYSVQPVYIVHSSVQSSVQSGKHSSAHLYSPSAQWDIAGTQLEHIWTIRYIAAPQLENIWSIAGHIWRMIFRPNA